MKRSKKICISVMLLAAFFLTSCGPVGIIPILGGIFSGTKKGGKADVAEIATVTLAVSSDYGNPTPPTGAHEYSIGSSITASVTSPYPPSATDTRYVCTGWMGVGSVPVSGSINSVTFSITQDSTLTWLWQTQHHLQTITDPTGVGTVYSNPTGDWQDEGTVVTLFASSTNPSYVFEQWQIDASGTSNPTTATLDAPKMVIAKFKVVGSSVKLTVSSSYGSPNPPVGDSFWGSGDTVNASVSAFVDDGQPTRYKCAGWSGTGSVSPPSGSTNSVSFSISADSTLTWLWQVQHKLTVTINPVSSGTVSSSPASADWYYDDGASVTLTANPSAGYSFSEWTGALTGSANPATPLVMDGPKSVTANFAVLPPNAPSGFSSIANSTSAITWLWSDTSNDETGFEIQDALDAVKGTVGADTTSWQETSLSENTQYTRHVHSVKSGLYSTPSNDAACYTFVHDATASDFTVSNIQETVIFQDGFETGTLTGWTNDPTYPWSTTVAEKHSGVYSARSGSPGMDNSIIKRSFNISAGGGKVTFWWRINTNGYLFFSIDGIGQGEPDNFFVWEQKTFSLAAGIRTLGWNYNGGTGSGYIDDIVVTDFGTPSQTVTITVTPPANQNAGNTGVRIERDNSDSFPAPAIVQDYDATYTTTDTPGTGTWFYRIQFRNGDGVPSAYSAGKSVTVP